MITDVKQITTAQEVFDYVANHLITQGKPALNKSGACVYRTKDGSSCGVGCLMADDEYNRKFENKSVVSVLTLDVKKGASFQKRMYEHSNLLECLQQIHDRVLMNRPKDLIEELITLARLNNLKVNFA